jgi:anion-transporting  ArsA/GET3 family ATPase
VTDIEQLAQASRHVSRAAPLLDIDALLNDPGIRVIVCCGSGGVGKTTTAAALALRAAESGRRTCVLTIDPARRLAQSMGLTELDNTPRAIADVGPGELSAMMLDMKRTFDEIVIAHSDPERAESILNNPFYQALSSSFAGTQEYMAMEKLGQLRAQSDAERLWDLIIVDTPPSRSALDFLDAPKRLGSFLDGRLIRILAAPARGAGRITGRVVAASLGVFTNVLNKIIGAQMLTDLQVFIASFDALFGGFRERAESTYAQLKALDTRFVVVAIPETDALREASYFVERLAEEDMPLAGLVLNRVIPELAADLTVEAADSAAAVLAEENTDAVTEGLLRLHAARQRAARRQDHVTDSFIAAHPQVPVVPLPAFGDDVHDLEGLRNIGDAAAGGVPARST